MRRQGERNLYLRPLGDATVNVKKYTPSAYILCLGEQFLKAFPGQLDQSRQAQVETAHGAFLLDRYGGGCLAFEEHKRRSGKECLREGPDCIIPRSDSSSRAKIPLLADFLQAQNLCGNWERASFLSISRAENPKRADQNRRIAIAAGI